MEATLTTTRYRVVARTRQSYEPEPLAVFVADAVAQAADSTLALLARLEASLGDRRFSPRGDHSDVDDLYDRLNDRIRLVKTSIAQEALRALAGTVEGDTELAAVGAFFSVHAGCETCSCSPGVVMGAALALDGVGVDVWVEPTN